MASPPIHQNEPLTHDGIAKAIATSHDDDDGFTILPFPTPTPPASPSLPAATHSAATSDAAAPADEGWGWADGVRQRLSRMARGPQHGGDGGGGSGGGGGGGVASGKELAEAVADMRQSLGLERCMEWNQLEEGMPLFFDRFLSPAERDDFFRSVLPSIAHYALNLPKLVAAQAQQSRSAWQQGSTAAADTNLRVLQQQQPGIVLLSQELAASILSTAFFCLFPSRGRRDRCLPDFNFDSLYRPLFEKRKESQASKLRCLLQYFRHVANQVPNGFLSFERKVLPWPDEQQQQQHQHVATDVPAYPNMDYWRASNQPLCALQVEAEGLIEDGGLGALQVDFANARLGGGVLRAGSVQEEILFAICPELMVGMLFMARMEDNESIEMVGAQRFCRYSGYADSFTFTGGYDDDSCPRDAMGRRRRYVVAMDALARVGARQFQPNFILREANKVLCGFLDHAALRNYPTATQLAAAAQPETVAAAGVAAAAVAGVATGNWGCGAFGGDVQLKAMVQWMAASQAGRALVKYFTFRDPRAVGLEEVVEWVRNQRLTVGMLWTKLLLYGEQRPRGKGARDAVGFFQWFLKQTK